MTNTPFDRLGLSPYRSILFGMSVGSMLKQNIVLLTMTQEEMTPLGSTVVGVLNAVFNSINALLFICSQTSASVNGEHFPQTPLLVGSTMYVAGLFIEWFSEVQRTAFKKDPANKGKIYEGGLFGLSRHINYFGYTLWRSGYALAAGGWVWAAVVGAFFTYDFTQRGIPVLQHYLEERVSLPINYLTEGDLQFANAVCSTASNSSTTRTLSRTSSRPSCIEATTDEGRRLRVTCRLYPCHYAYDKPYSSMLSSLTDSSSFLKC